MSAPVSIFDSNDDPNTQEGGYEIAVSMGADGSIDAVAIIDHEMGDILEVPPEIALLFARVILEKVRDPKASVN